jgi:hypothetical protein
LYIITIFFSIFLLKQIPPNYSVKQMSSFLNLKILLPSKIKHDYQYISEEHYSNGYSPNCTSCNQCDHCSDGFIYESYMCTARYYGKLCNFPICNKCCGREYGVPSQIPQGYKFIGKRFMIKNRHVISRTQNVKCLACKKIMFDDSFVDDSPIACKKAKEYALNDDSTN